ncbi:MAG: hypothetical protein AAB535_00685 [Patescibacteria group bacterium]
MEPETPVEANVPSQIPDSHWITILAMALFVVASLSVVAFLYSQNQQLKKMLASYQITPTPTSSASIPSTSIPVATATTAASLKPGWKLYQNEQYKFEFSHPSSYKVLTDAENLYGWPKAILLLYKGGQSYDLAVEIWNTEAEYKAKYTDTSTYNVFKTKDGKFITLLNANKDAEVAEIISTFKFTD